MSLHPNSMPDKRPGDVIPFDPREQRVSREARPAPIITASVAADVLALSAAKDAEERRERLRQTLGRIEVQNMVALYGKDQVIAWAQGTPIQPGTCPICLWALKDATCVNPLCLCYGQHAEEIL